MPGWQERIQRYSYKGLGELHAFRELEMENKSVSGLKCIVNNLKINNNLGGVRG